jgi:hypothetical protein
MNNRNIKHNRRINNAKSMKHPKIGNKPKKTTNQFYGGGGPKILLPKKPKSKRREPENKIKKQKIKM